MGIWNQYRLARQVGPESQRPNFGGLLSSAYFSAARHDRHIFQCPLREASACCSTSSAPGGWQFSGAGAAALPAGAIFQRWRGLYSTASDYLKFARMLLNGGKLGNKRILQSETVAQMSRNQIGDLMLVELRSQIPQFAKDPVRIPGYLDKFGLGFATNTKPVEGGRSSGSLAWAGVYNTFFWIDPPRKICAVIMMQILPCTDDAANSVVERFERAVYVNSAGTVAPGRGSN